MLSKLCSLFNYNTDMRTKCMKNSLLKQLQWVISITTVSVRNWMHTELKHLSLFISFYLLVGTLVHHHSLYTVMRKHIAIGKHFENPQRHDFFPFGRIFFIGLQCEFDANSQMRPLFENNFYIVGLI